MTTKLLQHFKRMQECAARYIEPKRYYSRNNVFADSREGDAMLFADDLIYLLDSPEQREAQAEAEQSVGISALYRDVRDFHVTFGHPYSDTPVLQPKDRVEARADWIAEEVQELRDATTIVDQADAYIDALYFAIGGLVEIGVEPSRIWAIVHGANMAKVQSDGSVKRREDGKIQKPEGWIAPEPLIVAEIKRQRGLTAQK